jgi:AcrR family transcriptional regulator
MATREDAKDRRRREIVRAARVLMQQMGNTGFSMRALAEEAGVSIATPYNLFGSKQAVMYAVLDADLEQYLERLQRLRADEIEVFFKAVTLTSSLYASEASFYRAVLFAAYNAGGTQFRSIFDGPRHAMWKGLVSDAKQAGMIREDVEPAAFAINLGHIFFSCILEWVNDVISLEELDARVQYGFAVALHGVCTPACSERLWDKVTATQKRLKAVHKKRLKARTATAAQTGRVNGAA